MSGANTAEVFPLNDGGLLFRWRWPDDSTMALELDADGDAVVLIRGGDHHTTVCGLLRDTWPQVYHWLGFDTDTALPTPDEETSR